MNVIFCHSYDRDAIWFYLQMQQRGLEVQLLALEEVLMAEAWTQKLDNTSNDFYLSTHSGLTIRSGEIGFFFNRARVVDPPVWRLAAKKDQEYVRSELAAMLMSWLYQVQKQCLMINPPVGHSLCGPAWSAAEWARGAFHAGFEEVAENGGPPACSKQRLLVIGSTVLSTISNVAVWERCITLSKLAQSPLLEVTVLNQGQTFLTGNPFPALQSYGTAFADAIHRELTASAQ